MKDPKTPDGTPIPPIYLVPHILNSIFSNLVPSNILTLIAVCLNIVKKEGKRWE